MFFSLIIPVYNRPDEVQELLESLTQQVYRKEFEIVIVEDGSATDCRAVVLGFSDKLNISYYYKQNTGPGDSRNFGMERAKGDYFIILDSDCIIPQDYLENVALNLETQYADCFGGPDAAHDSFSPVQKAINFTMTSFLTTGGVRGKSEKAGKFQPRSFNMGLSSKAFKASGGFGNIHPGEDPDLAMRLWKMGFDTRLYDNCKVYHKRRIDWEKFYIQVNKFGKARPILDLWHPEYKKVTFLFPSIFMLGFAISLILLLIDVQFVFYLFTLYFCWIFIASAVYNRSIWVGLLSIIAVFIQFYGYGTGYMRSFIKMHVFKEAPQKAFPELFFK